MVQHRNLHPADPHPKIIGKGALPTGKGAPNIGMPAPREDQPWDPQKAFLQPLTSARALCDWKNTASLWPHLGGQQPFSQPYPSLLHPVRTSHSIPSINSVLTFGTGGPRSAATWGPGIRQR